MMFSELNPVVQALIGTGFTWIATAIGSATVFFFHKINKLFLETMLGFAAGIMIAASYWSLLAPAISLSNGWWFPPICGFFTGRIVLAFVRSFHSSSTS